MKYKAKVTFAKVVEMERVFEVEVDEDEDPYTVAWERAAQIETGLQSLSIGYMDKLHVADDLKFITVFAAEEPFEVEVLEAI